MAEQRTNIVVNEYWGQHSQARLEAMRQRLSAGTDAGYNQHAVTVIAFTRTFMVYRRGHVPKVQRESATR